MFQKVSLGDVFQIMRKNGGSSLGLDTLRNPFSPLIPFPREVSYRHRCKLTFLDEEGFTQISQIYIKMKLR
jgi:hypothetical protein